MSRSQINLPGDDPSALTNRPAIGLVAAEDEADVIAGAVLRARTHDLQPIVIACPEADDETIEFAQHLEALVIEPGTDLANGTEPINELTEVARSAGFPGLIHHVDPAAQIDYDRSEALLRDHSRYWIEAVTGTDDDQDEQIIVGIPAYNEEVGIGSVILGANRFADEIIVVDDGSTDNTVEVARSAGATVIEHDVNRGKGAAVQTLFDAVASETFAALILIDGDGQHFTGNIEQVVGPVLEGDADLVIGSRYLEPSADDETPRHRRLGQRVLDTLTLGSSRTKVTDSQSGFRALSPTAVEKLELTTDSFGVETEMIDSAAQNDLRIHEEPIDVRYLGIDGQTQNPFRHGLSVATFILGLVRDRHPLLFFGMPGLLLLLLGGWIGVDAILIYRLEGVFYPWKVVASGFMTILGTLAIFIGLVLNRIGNMLSQLEGVE